MDSFKCSRCESPLEPGVQRFVPRTLAVTAAFAFALLHAGMWARETLREPLCRRCRRIVCGQILACAAVIAGAFFLGAYWWISLAKTAAPGPAR